jgi:hypothetical protein
MNFGPQTLRPTATIMDAAVDAGVNFLDTANVYGGVDRRGWTEEIVGRWLAKSGRRDEIVLATKAYGEMTKVPNQSRLSALNLRRACDASLRRLQTDHIDLYQMHHVDRNTPWDEIWQAMDVLVAQGKISYVGSSNFAGWHIAAACGAASARHSLGLVSEQSLYNLTARTIELEVPPRRATDSASSPGHRWREACSEVPFRRRRRDAGRRRRRSSASRSSGRNSRSGRPSAPSWASSPATWRWPGRCTRKCHRPDHRTSHDGPARGRRPRSRHHAVRRGAGATRRDLPGSWRGCSEAYAWCRSGGVQVRNPPAHVGEQLPGDRHRVDEGMQAERRHGQVGPVLDGCPDRQPLTRLDLLHQAEGVIGQG